MVKKFKHPVVQWAHEHPILFSLFGTTIFFYFPARLIGKTIRTVQHGDPTLGGIPGLMSTSERDLFTGSGTVSMHQLGAIPSPADGAITGGALYRSIYDEMCERARNGEIAKEHVQYHATARYNKLMNDGQYNITIKTAPGPDQGKNAGDFYRDSRHNQFISSYTDKHANPYNPSAALPNQVPVGNSYSEHSSSPGSFAVNPSVRNLLGENSVFAGLGAAHKLR